MKSKKIFKIFEILRIGQNLSELWYFQNPKAQAFSYIYIYIYKETRLDRPKTWVLGFFEHVSMAWHDFLGKLVSLVDFYMFDKNLKFFRDFCYLWEPKNMENSWFFEISQITTIFLLFQKPQTSSGCRKIRKTSFSR